MGLWHTLLLDGSLLDFGALKKPDLSGAGLLEAVYFGVTVAFALGKSDLTTSG